MRDGSDAAVPTTVALADGPVEVVELAASGDGVGLPPLVWHHEGLGSLDLWRSMPFELHRATGRRTVVWSRHGYGRSAVVPRGTRDERYLHREAERAVPQLLDALGLTEVVHVGHSDGATISLLHAADPGGIEVAGVAALAPHVVVEQVTVDGLAATREAFVDGGLRERLARYHDDVEGTFWGWNDVWLSDAFRSFDVTGLLPAITCPVLLLQGVGDGYATMRQLDLIERGVTGPVTRVELDDCGHSPHLEQPDATRTALLAWLDGLG